MQVALNMNTHASAARRPPQARVNIGLEGKCNERIVSPQEPPDQENIKTIKSFPNRKWPKISGGCASRLRRIQSKWRDFNEEKKKPAESVWKVQKLRRRASPSLPFKKNSCENHNDNNCHFFVKDLIC